MPFSIRIDKERKLIVSTFLGRFTPEVILEGRRALGQEPGFDPSFAHILDLTGVTQVEIRGPAVERLSQDRTMFDKESVQVIVAPEKLKFELAKLFKRRSAKERPALEITRTLEAALALVALRKAKAAR